VKSAGLRKNLKILQNTFYLQFIIQFMSNTPQPIDTLQRFLDAQEWTYVVALDELQNGHKESHWMWFIFPQVLGLGQSEMSLRFAIRDRKEAEAYLAHSVLGPRLLTCCEALMASKSTSATELLGYPDDLKLRSSMTLYADIAEDPYLFYQVLEKYFNGNHDPRTLEIMDNW
jgi:uncharacterized protein (DUF1810 family)